MYQLPNLFHDSQEVDISVFSQEEVDQAINRVIFDSDPESYP